MSATRSGTCSPLWPVWHHWKSSQAALLVGPVHGVGRVVDARRLTVGVPLLDRPARAVELLDNGGVRRRSVAAHQPDGGTGAVARDEVAAVARVVLGAHRVARHVAALPAIAVEHRLVDGGDAVGEEDRDQPVVLLEVPGVRLAKRSLGEVLEADGEPAVLCSRAGALRRPVGLHGHEQRGVEALRLPVARVGLDLLRSGSPGQRPRGVRDEKPRPTVRVHEVSPARGDAPEAVPREDRGGLGRSGGERAGASAQPRIGVPVEGRPTPSPRGPRGGEAHAEGAAAVPERGAAQPRAVVVGEVHPGLDVGVGVGRVARGRQLQLDLLPLRGPLGERLGRHSAHGQRDACAHACQDYDEPLCELKVRPGARPQDRQSRRAWPSPGPQLDVAGDPGHGQGVRLDTVSSAMRQPALLLAAR